VVVLGGIGVAWVTLAMIVGVICMMIYVYRGMFASHWVVDLVFGGFGLQRPLTGK